ncbi:MAG: DUF3352 domain-containing protein [Leptolyngbyaceae cyanobacterium SL_1_1]|nr:DUF3352 domain-containing protein [Leptolyngbyaceae cyanobacterium SL_1_1]
MLSTSTEGLQEALAVDDRSILKSADFKAAIAALKSQNDGYLYLDWPQVGPHLMQQSSQLRWLSTSFQPFLKYLKSIIISSYGSDADFQRGGIFIRLMESP